MIYSNYIICLQSSTDNKYKPQQDHYEACAILWNRWSTKFSATKLKTKKHRIYDAVTQRFRKNIFLFIDWCRKYS